MPRTNDEGWETVFSAGELTAGAETVPRKIRELVKDLLDAGFADRGGRGGHRNFVHARVSRPVTISGQLGGDAKRYQERAVRLAIEESRR